jgi:outer membrane protein assembly factor BamB
MVAIWVVLALTGMAWAGDWPQFRGPGGDGLSPDVPQTMPAKQLRWSVIMADKGYAGAVVSGDKVVVMDFVDGNDLVRCLDLATGAPLWTTTLISAAEDITGIGYAARATPAIWESLVYTFSTGGDLTCLDLKDGTQVWRVNMAEQYQATPPMYGYCSSPAVKEGRVICAAGAKDAAIVALDAKTGKELWRGAGSSGGYASFCIGTFGGVAQVVTQNDAGLASWEFATGKPLWTVPSPKKGDFFVNTPLDIDGQLFIATDNNDARLFSFGADGQIIATPVATSKDYAPDAATPVYYQGLIWGTSSRKGLVALDPADGLRTVWTVEDWLLYGFSTIIAGNDHLLVCDDSGDIRLIEAARADSKIIGKITVSEGGDAHIALVKGTLLVRDNRKLYGYAF